MAIPIRYARVTGGVAVLIAGLSGCADTGACAGVGVVSQVGVYVVQDGYDDLAGASWELCTRGKCVRGEFEQEAVTQANLVLPDDVDPDTDPVRFRVTGAGATKPFIDDSVDVKLLHQSDNCGGGGYSRGLAYTKEAGLLPSVPKEVSAAWLEQRESEATAEPGSSASS
ncbi:hypothetical protein ACFV0T_01655 [Streptomyces sp. NPDC059582]|uniref:hypothetical protein n=1 Tax=Streptomyces sp. NPDC059582 TaxID=3346875 RepID=UPI0036B56214